MKIHQMTEMRARHATRAAHIQRQIDILRRLGKPVGPLEELLRLTGECNSFEERLAEISAKLDVYAEVLPGIIGRSDTQQSNLPAAKPTATKRISAEPKSYSDTEPETREAILKQMSASRGQQSAV